MAILNSLVVNGSSRFLNKAYFNDIQISGAATFASLSLSGNLSVSGTSTLTGNTTVGGTLGVTGAATFSNTVYMTRTTDLSGVADNKPALIIGTLGGSHLEFDPDEIHAKSDASHVSSLFLNVNGGNVYLSGNQMYSNYNSSTGIHTFVTPNLSVGTLLSAPTASISTINADNVSVTNNLHATHFDLQTVAQLGGSFYVSPTLKFPNSGGTLAVTKSGSTLTLTITDSSITSTQLAGIAWSANSKVKVSGTINGVVTGTMDGTITGINPGSSSGTLTISCSGENSGSVVASPSGSPYTASQFSDLSVMVYQRRDGSNNYRVGIWMNCYDLETKIAAIRLYGGTSAKPNVMIGNLDQATLDAVGGITPTGWSLYAQNAFLQGAVVSNEGQIGGWTIGQSALFNATNSMSSTSVGLYLGTDGIRNYASTTQYVNITAGKITALGVDLSGKITATSGAIGGFDITSTAIKTKDVAVTSNADNSISLSSADFTRTINSTSRSGLRFAIGDKFGVTGDGVIYASSVDLTGKITATSGTIGGCSITNGVLKVADANISGTISASHIDASSLTIGQSQVTNLTTDLGNKASTSDVTALTNKVNAVYGTSSTIQGTQAKAVTCSNFELFTGALITVKFSNANTYASGAVQLNVNSKGAKNIWVSNAITSASNQLLWGAGAEITFRYDGTQFSVIGEPRNWSGQCATAASTAAKTDTVSSAATIPGCVICKGTIVSLSMTNENTATSPTLNIAGTGAKNLYAGSGTTRPTTTNGFGWTAGSTVPFVFDGQYWRVGDTAGLARAYSAQSTASSAQSAASTAQGAAEAAQSAASTAQGAAEAAQSTANTANTNATNAAKTATNFITADSNGIKVHNTSNTTDYIHIISSGTTVYKGGNDVANFGDTVRIGRVANSQTRILIDSDSLDVISRNSSGTDTTYATFGATATIGKSTGYNTYVDSNGVYIKNNSTTLATYGSTITIGQSSGFHTFIDSNGFHIINGSNVYLASYGANVTIGQTANNKTRIYIDNDSLDVISRNGSGTDTRVATFGSTATIGNMSSRGVSIDANGFKFNNGGTQNFFIGVDSRQTQIQGSGSGTVTNSSATLTINGRVYYRVSGTIQSSYTITSVYGTLTAASDLNGDEMMFEQSENPVKSFSVQNVSGTYYLYVRDGFDQYSTFSESITYNYTTLGTTNTPYMVLGTSAYSSQNIPGSMSFAQGNSCIASGINSFASGYACVASGTSSFSGGIQSESSGGISFSHGVGSVASNLSSIAIGYHATSSGAYSAAIGSNVTSSGSYSIALGQESTASGIGAFAMGTNTTASGVYSTTMGYHTTASWGYNTALGYYTYASRYAQLVTGTYNVLDTTPSTAVHHTSVNFGNYAFIIGNGYDESHRSNAFTVDWKGNAIAAGNITATGSINTTHVYARSGTVFANNVSTNGITTDDITAPLFIYRDFSTSSLTVGANAAFAISFSQLNNYSVPAGYVPFAFSRISVNNNYLYFRWMNPDSTFDSSVVVGRNSASSQQTFVLSARIIFAKSTLFGT